MYRRDCVKGSRTTGHGCVKYLRTTGHGCAKGSHRHRCGGGRCSRTTHDYVKYLRTTHHGCVVARRTRVYFELNSNLFSEYSERNHYGSKWALCGSF